MYLQKLYGNFSVDLEKNIIHHTVSCKSRRVKKNFRQKIT